MGFSSQRVLWLLAVAACLGIVADTVRAEYIAEFSGNANIKNDDPRLFDLTVNFAVLRNSGQGGDDPFGVGDSGFVASLVPGAEIDPSQGADVGAEYLYLYQIANNGSDALRPVRAFTLRAPGIATSSSWGFFAGYGLMDSSGAVTTLNNFGDDAMDFLFQDLTSTHVGASIGSSIVNGISDGMVPIDVSVSLDDLTFNASFHGAAINSGQRSVVFGYTSDRAPALDLVFAQDGAPSASGYVASPVPEPTALVGLASLGAALAIGGLRRRLRRIAAGTHG